MSARVPLMITARMRADLRALGLADDEIDALTPSEAWARLGGAPAPDRFTIALSVNRLRKGKMPAAASGREWARYNDAFANMVLEPAEVAALIEQGYAISCRLKPGTRRKAANFEAAQHIGIDFDTEDERATLATLSADPFIAQYAALLHTTSSHTPDKPRARVLFFLDEPVCDVEEYRGLVLGLMRRFGSVPDQHAKDPARIWYGAPGCDLLQLGNVLPLAVARELARDAAAPARSNGHPMSADIPASTAAPRYAQAALAGEAVRVRQAPPGERNHTLNRAAYALGQLVGAGELDEATVIAELAAAARHTGLAESEIGTTLRSGLEAGRKQPRRVPARSNGHYQPPAPNATNGAGGAEPIGPSAPNGLRMLVANGRQLRDVAREALEALRLANTPPSVFVRGGVLVRRRYDEQGRPLIEAFDESALRGRLARVADFVKRIELNEVVKYSPAVPPAEVVSDILSHGDAWPFPRLTGIVEAPALRPDGTVLDVPGYDEATGLIYAPAPGLVVDPIPEAPTEAQTAAALAQLRELWADFPFADAASETHAVALTLTLLLRDAIPGPAPAFAVNATNPGSGKALMVDVNATIATGRPGVMNPLSKGEELRKLITALLNDGARMIVFDNVTGTLYSPILAAALTAQEWRDRILGKSETPSIPQRAVWVVTGNAIQLGGDLPRRFVFINIDPKMSEPWTRAGFKHPDLVGWARAHRGRLIAAALTLARAWYAAGCPAARMPVLGSFTEWARIIGSILAHAGASDFLGNLRQMYQQADEETPAWEAFLLALHERFAGEDVTVADIAAELAASEELREAMPDLGEALLDDAGKVRARFKQALGHAFRSRAGRRHGESQARVEQARRHNKKDVARWRIDQGGTLGTLGTPYELHARAGDISPGKTGDESAHGVLKVLKSPPETDGPEPMATLEPGAWVDAEPPEPPPADECAELQQADWQASRWQG